VLTAPLRLLGVLPQETSAMTASATASAAQGGVLLDARDATSVAAFGALDDGVMGGVSVSELVRKTLPVGGVETPVAVFQGVVSTANNGGFASVRNRNWEPAKDCGNGTGISVRCLGDGQRYKLFLRTETGWDAIAYGCSFDTVAGEWATINLPFSSFKAIFRARTVLGAPPLNPRSIRSVQIMLSKFEYDNALNPNFKGAGPFSLPITSIQTYI